MARVSQASALVVCVLVATACASSTSQRERAFVEAGRRIRAAEAGHTYDEIVREIELFLKDEVTPLGEKARLQEEGEVDRYRKIWIIGSAAAVVAGTSGTLADPGHRDAQIAIGAAGAAVALGGFVLWEVRTHELAACRTFLAASARDLKRWAETNLERSSKPAPPELWREYVDRISGIRSYPKCLRVRTP